MPISPDPPSGRKTSSSRLSGMRPSGFGVAGVDQHQPADGEVGIDMVDRRMSGRKRCASPPVATTVMGLPYSSLMRVDQAVDQPDIAPIDARLHAWARCRLPITFWARWMATRGSSAAAWCSASIERLAPGAITLPSKSPFSRHDVEIGGGAEIHHDQRALVAVMRGDGVAQPVGAHRFGPVDIGLDAQIERRDRPPPAARI